MSCLISLNNISYKYNLDSVLKNVDFSINKGDRVAIAGHNGSGKTTLMNILSGKLQEFEGLRSLKVGLRFESVEQFLNPGLKELTLLEALSWKLPFEERAFLEYKAERLLEDLFFDHSEFGTKVENLSGGAQNRLMFARAIISEPDLVFMDEPTNHLDLKSLLYIEDYIINKSKCAFGIISHDLSFLNRVSNKTVILRDKSSYTFSLNYGKSLLALEKLDEDAKKRRVLEEKEINRLKKSAKRLAEWGRTFDNQDLSKKAKSMEKRVQKLEDQKTFVSLGNPYELGLSFEKLSSKIALQIHELDVFYGERLQSDGKNHLFHVDDFYINAGEKVVLLGGNGAGKSTLIKTILQKINQQERSKHFNFAPNLDYGLYDQEQEVLSFKETLLKEVIRISKAHENEAKLALIRSGFSFDRHHEKCGNLSGGEKSRVIFCALLLQSSNFLVLDEPTNHIDLDGKTELIASLKGSKVTALITGHDRTFIEEVGDRFVVIENGKLLEVNSPQYFYESLLKPPSTKQTQGNPVESSQANECDDVLARILELEKKLAENLNRRPKFQKPKLQEQWQKEIKKLYQALE